MAPDALPLLMASEIVPFFGLLYVSWKLATYPSPEPTLTLTSHLGQNVGLGEGWAGSFPVTYNDLLFFTETPFWVPWISQAFSTWPPSFFVDHSFGAATVSQKLENKKNAFNSFPKSGCV